MTETHECAPIAPLMADIVAASARDNARVTTDLIDNLTLAMALQRADRAEKELAEAREELHEIVAAARGFDFGDYTVREVVNGHWTVEYYGAERAPETFVEGWSFTRDDAIETARRLAKQEAGDG